MCYFGDDNVFEFADGLNVILGENGEGKTKFFEAIEWLFNGEQDLNFKAKISAKALREANEDDSFEVSVGMEVEQYNNIKIVERSFIVTKREGNDISIQNSGILGIEENKNHERTKVDGNRLLDIIFPVEIRRYSLFKGESELNIFGNNPDALNNLIHSFSDARYYEKYLTKGIYLKKKAETAVDKEARSNSKRQADYKRLESEIASRQKRLVNLEEQIDIQEEQLKKVTKGIKEAERYVENADALETIKNRIARIRNQLIRAESRIQDNYTTYLFDRNWMLSDFEPIHQQYANKVKNLHEERRKLEQEFNIEEGKRLGKEELKKELLDGMTPLPLGVPSKAYMEEMLSDFHCKVCNRPAKKGSPPYEYMQKRFKEYLEKQAPKTKEKKKQRKYLFKHNYIQLLFKLGSTHEDSLSDLRAKKTEIEDRFSLNAGRLRDIEKLREQLESEEKDREKIIGTSVMGEERLSNILKNYNNWQKDKISIDRKLSSLKLDKERINKALEEKIRQKEEIDEKSTNSFLRQTRRVLRDIEVVFRETKEKKYDEFISKLQAKSNSIFQQINIDDFTGVIVFKKETSASKNKISIELHENGNIFYSPNQSLKTSRDMAILFAISELAAESKEQKYPMIFDAPTSSFGETKTKDFLNLVYETNKQRIILFYDFIGKDKNGNQVIKPDFEEVKRHKAFWIKRQRPFDKNDLSTINTQIINL